MDLIILTIYFLGIFITPILLKKFCEIPSDKELFPLDRKLLIFMGSFFWPIVLATFLIIRFTEILYWIYNKI